MALVAARTEDIAEKALNYIEVEYEKLPAVFDIEEALSPDAPPIWDQYPNNVLPGEYVGFGPKSLKDIIIGDAAKGLEEADFVVEGTASYAHIPNPLPIEPPGVIAKWDSPSQLTMWSASQSPAMPRFNMIPVMRF